MRKVKCVQFQKRTKNIFFLLLIQDKKFGSGEWENNIWANFDRKSYDSFLKIFPERGSNGSNGSKYEEIYLLIYCYTISFYVLYMYIYKYQRSRHPKMDCITEFSSSWILRLATLSSLSLTLSLSLYINT